MDLRQEGMGAHEEQERLNQGHAADAAIQSEATLAEIGVFERERQNIMQTQEKESPAPHKI